MAVSWPYFCSTDIMPETATPNSFNQNESHPFHIILLMSEVLSGKYQYDSQQEESLAQRLVYHSCPCL